MAKRSKRTKRRRRSKRNGTHVVRIPSELVGDSKSPALDVAKAMLEGDTSNPIVQQIFESLRPESDSQALAVYLEALRVCVLGSKEARSGTPIGDHLARISRALGAARIVEVHRDTIGGLHHVADVYTTEEIAGQRWSHPAEKAICDFDRDEYIDKVREAGRHLPLTERLPFPSTFFALVPPLHYPKETVGCVLRERTIEHETLDGVLMYGLLVCPDLVIEFSGFVQDGEPYLVPLVEMDNGTWHEPFNLSPWIVNGLCELIAQFRAVSVTEHRLSYLDRHEFKRRARKQGTPVLPRPYYTVDLSTTVTHKIARAAVERGDSERGKRSISYRYDVRSHERVYVHRGPKPLDDETRDKLVDRGFAIYLDAVAPDDLVRLSVRGVKPKRPDEWIAMRSVNVRAHVRGDDALPYVPSILRVPSS